MLPSFFESIIKLYCFECCSLLLPPAKSLKLFRAFGIDLTALFSTQRLMLQKNFFFFYPLFALNAEKRKYSTELMTFFFFFLFKTDESKFRIPSKVHSCVLEICVYFCRQCLSLFNRTCLVFWAQTFKLSNFQTFKHSSRFFNCSNSSTLLCSFPILLNTTNPFDRQKQFFLEILMSLIQFWNS